MTSNVDTDFGDRRGEVRIPVWDGRAQTLRDHRKDIDWWLEGEDLDATLKYNLASRYANKQPYLVRQRAREFAPSQLRAIPAVVDGDGNVTTAANYRAGIDILLQAFEDMVGLDPPEQKAELLDTWHKKFNRKHAERIIDYCQRFRDLREQLNQAGVTFSEEDAGYMLRDRARLSDNRLELLDTATGGSYKAADIQKHMIRIFKRVHLTETRFDARTAAPDGKRHMLSQITKWANRGAARPTASQASGSWKSASSSGHRWRANVADTADDENQDEPAGAEAAQSEAPEETPAEEDTPEPPAEFEAYLTQQLQEIGAELEDAEKCGLDTATIEELEAAAESVAEAYVTMKEAKSKMQSMRKDRRYGQPSSSTPGGRKREVTIPERKVNSKCFDCGEPGHWAGDDACKRPGAGLFRSQSNRGNDRSSISSSSRSGGPPRRNNHSVRIAEADDQIVWEARVAENLNLGAEAMAADHSTSGQATPEAGPTLAESLAESSRPRAAADGLMSAAADARVYKAALTSVTNAVRHTAEGALDSACNRTLSGHTWMFAYLRLLRDHNMLRYVDIVSESEWLRFGNHGRLESKARYKIPVLVYGIPLFFWVSVVDCATLGLLIGKDVMRALGLRIDFCDNMIDSKVLDFWDVKLGEFSAGQLRLPLLNGNWLGPKSPELIRLGSTGVVEVFFRSV